MKKPKMSPAGWRSFKGETLPQTAIDFGTKHDIWRSGSNFSKGGGLDTWRDANWLEAMYKGEDPETATEWVIVTDNGGYFKVFALYMIWMPNGGGHARWSNHTLTLAMRAIRTGNPIAFDPNYQT